MIRFALTSRDIVDISKVVTAPEEELVATLIEVKRLLKEAYIDEDLDEIRRRIVGSDHQI